METIKYLGLLALSTWLFYWKTCLTGQYTLIIGSEGVNLTYGWLHFWIRSLREWRVPLWDPYAFCGRPFGAEMLPASFYPLHLPLVLVPFDANGMIPAAAITTA